MMRGFGQQASGGGGSGLTPPWANVVSLLHFDSAYTDQKGRVWTNNAGSISTTTKKYGAGSLYLVTSANLITPYSTDFNFGSNDFTVEAWIYVLTGATSGGQYRTIIAKDDVSLSSNRGWIFLLDGDLSGKINFSCRVGTTTYSVKTASAPSLSTWIHVAVVRDSGFLRLYVNGVQQDFVAITGSLNTPAVGTTIGVAKNGGTDLGPGFNGYIEDVRVVNGFCCYPGGTTFPTPPAALPDS